jgi:dihydroorotate dehydrogenase electron transfer subunit
VCVCGPEVMSRAVAAQAAAAGVACRVSLERLMACGIGACLSCVVTTVDGRERACVDGPVFDADRIVWDASEVPPRH